MTDRINESNLRVGIDGRGATSGSREVIRSMSDISAQAAKTVGDVRRVDDQVAKIGRDASGAKEVVRDLSKISTASDVATSNVMLLKSQLLQLGQAAVGIYGLSTALYKVQGYAKDTIDYLAKIETAVLGIAASFMVNGQFTDKLTGDVLKGQRALVAAQGASKKIVDELRVANYQTSATLDELIFAYEVTLPVAMAKGFNKQQVMDFTLAMVQAAGSIGLAYDQIAEETRSILTGNVTRNSRIAQILQLQGNQEYLKIARKGGQELFDYLDKRLEGFRVAGLEVNKTWEGMWSNFKDIARQASGFAFEDLFEGIKIEIMNLMENIVKFDLISRQLKWNPEFVASAKAIGVEVKHLFDVFVTGSKWVFEHRQQIADLIEFYVKYKVTIIAANIASSVYDSTVRRVIQAEQERLSLAAAKAASDARELEAANAKTASQRMLLEAYIIDAQVNKARAADQLAMLEVHREVVAAEYVKQQAITRTILLKKQEASTNRQALAEAVATHNAELTYIAKRITALEAEKAAILQKAEASGAASLDSASTKALQAAMNEEIALRTRLDTLTTEQTIASERLMAAKKLETRATKELDMAQRQLAVASAECSAINKQMATTELQLAAAEAERVALTAELTAVTSANTVAQEENNAAVVQSTWATRANMAAKTALGGVLKMMGGWVGLITAAIIAGIWAWDKWGNAAEKALEKANSERDALADTVRHMKAQIEYAESLKNIEESKTNKKVVVTEDDKLRADLGPQNYAAYLKSLDRENDLRNQITEAYKGYNAEFGENEYNNEKIIAKEKEINEALDREINLRNELIAHSRTQRKLEDDSNYAANPRIDTQAEKELRERQRLGNAYEAYMKALAENEIAGHRQKLATELADEQRRYNDGLIAVTEYYSRVAELRKADINLQVNAIRQQISATESNLEKLQETAVDNPAGQGILLTEKTKLVNLQTKLEELLQALQAVDSSVGVNLGKDLDRQAKGYDEIRKQLLQFSHDKVALAELDKESQKGSMTMIRLETELAAAQKANDANRIAAAQAAITGFNAYLDLKKQAAALDRDLSVKNDESVLLDQYSREKKMIKDNHQYKLKMIDLEIEARKKAGQQFGDLTKKSNIEVEKYNRDMYSASLKEAAYYTGTAGQLANQLAQAQDQGSRDGFESAKKFSIAATIMNTAAAVMQQLASMPGPAGWAAAALAAVTGAVQVANIMSTSFDGGGNVGTPGSFDASGAGGVGTVLGDKTAKTESLSNSNEFLENINADQYAELRKIKAELEKMNYNLTGLASSLVRASGAFDESSLNITGLGTKNNVPIGGDEWMGLLSASIFGPVGGAIDYLAVKGGKFLQDMGDRIGGIGGTLISGIGTIIALPGQIIGTALDWLSGGLFGTTTKSLHSAGINLGETNIGDLLAGGDANVSQFQTIRTKKDSWVSKKKVSFHDTFSEVDQMTQDLFTDMFNSMGTTLMMLAEGLGQDSQKVLDYTFDIGKINLKDLSGDEIAEKIGEVFSYAGDVAAEKLFGEVLMKYQQINEGPLETLVRIVAEKFVVLDALDKTGNKASGDLIELTQSIVDMSGGIEKFQENVSNYYDAFTTDTQKFIDQFEYLTEVLGDAGLSLPKTRKAYEELVASIDLSSPVYTEFKEANGLVTTGIWSAIKNLGQYAQAMADAEADQEQYVLLLQLAEAADQYYSALEAGLDTYNSMIDSQTESMLRLRSTVAQSMADNIGEYVIATYKSYGLFGNKTRTITKDFGEGDADKVLRSILRSREVFETYFETISARTDEFSQNMYMSLVGSMDAISEYFSSLDSLRENFEQKFYSEAALRIKNEQDLRAALAEVNLGLPKTRDAYRLLVESRNLDTEAGLKQYLTMLELADAADQYYSVLEDAMKSYKDMALEAIDIQLAASQAIKNLSTGNLTILSPEDQYNQLKQNFDATALRASSGDIQAQKNLPAIITEFLTASKSYFASGSGYTADYESGMAMLTAMSGLNESQASQLDLVQKQIDGLTSLREAMMEADVEKIVLTRQLVSLTADSNYLLNLYMRELLVGGAQIPSYDVGTSSVPYDMTANVHRDEIIIDPVASRILSKYGIQVHGGGGDQSGVESRLDAVVGQLEIMNQRINSMEKRSRLASNQ